MYTELTTAFRNRAEAVGAVVHTAAGGEEAARLMVRLCADKAPCELLLHSAQTPDTGPLSSNGVPTRTRRVLAAPDLTAAPGLTETPRQPVLKVAAGLTETPGLPEQLALTKELNTWLPRLCAEQDVQLVREQLRHWLDGVDVGVSLALCGVADNGACLLDVSDEDSRLAGMIAECHVILLPVTAIVPDLAATAPLLRALQAGSGMATYVTGPSRTADIERVAAVGVHGPLALHIILLNAPAEVPHV